MSADLAPSRQPRLPRPDVRWPATAGLGWVSAALLVASVAFGLAAVSSSPERGDVIGMWPVGLTTGALVLAPRGRRWPLGLVVLVIMAAALLGLSGLAV